MERETIDVSLENSISYLSDDCLLSIFNKLESESERSAFGLTCKNWFKVRNLGRKSLTFHCSFNPTIDKEHAKCIPKILAHSPCLNRISLAGLTELPESALSTLRMSGSSLKSLSFYCCSGITDDGLAQVAIGCPNLVVVELQSCFNITDVGLGSLSKGCRALKSVNIGSCMGISDQGVSAILSNCSNICTLIITGCRRLSGVGFRGGSSSFCYLEAESCMFSPDGLLDVVSGSGLKYLNLHKLGSSTGLDGLGNLAFAKSLCILNLRMCRYLTDDSVTQIASGCPLLEEWNLAVCHGVHLPGWSAIGLYCNKLRVLHVNRCRHICDQSLLALGNGCPRLEVLHINGCAKITNNGLALFTISRPHVNLRVDEVLSIGPSIENLFRLH
ncbi:F-box/LRR-repeat protein 12-like isoform X1 [Miscanthus floridulus]|uniref:F-box/LRR-repeat protein 12-like isoform X1 n=1 Tax=Miscanthus floridulus TaxID=154761 RepID=UPI00345812DC